MWAKQLAPRESLKDQQIAVSSARGHLVADNLDIKLQKFILHTSTKRPHWLMTCAERITVAIYSRMLSIDSPALPCSLSFFPPPMKITSQQLVQSSPDAV